MRTDNIVVDLEKTLGEKIIVNRMGVNPFQ